MKLAIIGSGNVAEALVEALVKLPGKPGKPELVQICARNEPEGRRLAAIAGVPYAGSPENLLPADLYILAVSDGAIEETAGKIPADAEAVVAHTSGGTAMDAIPERIKDRAVFYPLQTFSKGRDVDFSHIPVFTEYSTPHAGRTVGAFASALTGTVTEASSETRAGIHLAAVFASNFTNGMYSAAARILKDHGLSFDMLKPLIAETAAKALSAGDPASVQTGPALRGDTETMRRHLELLRSGNDRKTYGTYEEIYKILSENIWETSKKR